MSDFIKVRVGVLPGSALQEIGLVNDRTVRKALELAGIVADGHQIRVRGSDATLETILEDGDTVALLKKAKGAMAPGEYTDDHDGNDDGNDAGDDSSNDYGDYGHDADAVVEIRIGKLPGTMESHTLNGDHAVRDALEAANIGSIEGWEIRVQGQTVDLDYELESGDDVVLLKKSKGALN